MNTFGQNRTLPVASSTLTDDARAAEDEMTIETDFADG
jgi:hypothetical protein